MNENPISQMAHELEPSVKLAQELVQELKPLIDFAMMAEPFPKMAQEPNAPKRYGQEWLQEHLEILLKEAKNLEPLMKKAQELGLVLKGG